MICKLLQIFRHKPPLTVHLPMHAQGIDAQALNRGRKTRKHEHITVEMLSLEGYLDMPVQVSPKSRAADPPVTHPSCRRCWASCEASMAGFIHDAAVPILGD